MDVSGATAATTVLGTEVSMPLMVAPFAFQRLAHPDGEPGRLTLIHRFGAGNV